MLPDGVAMKKLRMRWLKAFSIQLGLVRAHVLSPCDHFSANAGSDELLHRQRLIQGLSMTDGFKVVVEALRDRIKNPFVPAFCVSWIIYNFGATFLLLKGESTASDRVASFFESVDWLYGIVAPAASALGYVTVMPWLVYWQQRIQRSPFERQRRERIQSELSIADDEKELAKKRATIEEMMSR